MIDYASLRAIAAIDRTGSFEKAAKSLNVTASAISQRVKQLEERLGVVLIARGNPCTATETGAFLCRHIEHVGMLEHALFERLPNLREAGEPDQHVTLHIATNADSLGTWFIAALGRYTGDAPHLLDIVVDDQDHTVDWLQRGKVVAAVTSLEKPVQGCRSMPLGAMRYHATASPDFVARHFPDGVTAQAIARAPALTFNQKDRLQSQWIVKAVGHDVAHASHWLPSTQGFVDASLISMGWGMNPSQLVAEHLKTGRLVELVPGLTLDTPLFWQVNRLAAEQLAPLTQAMLTTARLSLAQ